jgi:uncharacterized membrane protein YqhA
VLKHLLKVRYFAVIVALLAVLHAMAFLVMGTRAAFHAYALVLRGGDGPSHRPGVELLHSLDFLLIGLVLIILAFGVAKLFLVTPSSIAKDSLPTWLRIETFTDLKVLLWETILTALLIIGLSEISTDILGVLEWSTLVIPGSILLLAISLYFLKKA